jgi:hypothetical protein
MSRESVMALCLLVAGCLALPACGGEAEGKKAAELSWAKGVAEDFLDAAFAGKGEQAQTLIDSSLKSAFAKESEHRLGEWLNNSIAIQGFHDPVIRTETIAPDQDEAAFKGTFQQREQKRLNFSLRVVKDKESGKWRVSYFQFREQEEKK